MGLFGIYRRGDDAWTLLQALRRQIEVSTAEPGEPSTIDARVDALNNQLKEIRTIWSRCPQSPIDKGDFDRDIQNHEQAIEHLEGLAKTGFKNQCLDGVISAFGYRQVGDLEPVPIPPNEWAFLQLDFKSGDAHHQDAHYNAVRFLWTRQLTKDDAKAVHKALLVFPEIMDLPKDQRAEALDKAFEGLKAKSNASGAVSGQMLSQPVEAKQKVGVQSKSADSPVPKQSKTRPRRNAMGELIRKTFENRMALLGEAPSTQDVWDMLDAYDTDEILERDPVNPSGRQLVWITVRGDRKVMKRKTFENTVSKLRRETEQGP